MKRRASTRSKEANGTYHNIRWDESHKKVRKLQYKILVAWRKGDKGLVHILARSEGGKNNQNNLMVLHSVCHKSVTNNKDRGLGQKTQTRVAPALYAEYTKRGIIRRKLPKEPTKVA